MFKFRKLFSLEHDLLPRIPQEHINEFIKTPTQSTLPVDFAVSQTSSPHILASSLTNATNNVTPSKVISFSDVKHYKLGSSYGSVIRIGNSSSSNITSPTSMNNSGGISNSLPQSMSTLTLNSNSTSTHNSNDGDANDASSLSENSEEYQDMNDDNSTFYHQHQNQQMLNSAIQYNLCGSLNLRIIGREKNGVLLIARTSNVNGILQTFVDSYDLNNKQFHNILNYHGVITNATLSNDANRSFLVFTVRLPEKIISGDNKVPAKEPYSTFIYEVNKKHNIFHQLESTTSPITCQFIPGLHDKSSMTLLMYIGDEVHNIKISLAKQEDALLIKNQKPVVSKSSLKKFYWTQYDHNQQLLYTLQIKPRSIVNYPSTTPIPAGQSESQLRIYSIQSGKFQQVEDTVTLFLTNIDPSKLSANVPSPLGAYKFQSNNASPVHYDSAFVQQNIHVVKLPGNAYCLCHQEETTKQHIKISIYLLHLKQKIRYSIPINALDEEVQNSPVRVLFDSFGSLLMIYIPGYFFQFIDCSALDHEPCFGITLHRKDLSAIHEQDLNSYDSADLLSIRTNPYPKRISTNVIPFFFQTTRATASLSASTSPMNLSSTNLLSTHCDVLSNVIGTSNVNHPHPLHKSAPTSPLSQGSSSSSGVKIVQYLYDCQHGIIYQYQIVRESIIKLFDSNMEPGIDILSMHLAISHFEDRELGDSIISHAAKSNLITTELFKEYILANTFRIFKAFPLDPIYQQLLPLTCSENFESTAPTKILKDLEITAIQASFFPKKDSDFKKRFKSFEAKKSEIQNREGPTFTGFIKNLMGIEDSPVDLQNSLRRSLGPSDIQSLNVLKSLHRLGIDIQVLDPSYEEEPFKDITQYIQSVSEIWSQLSQKDSKDKLHDFALIYRTIQILVINNLYRSIKICYGSVGSNANLNDLTTIRDMKHSNRVVYFHTLEKLYAAIEELYCPFPKDFYSQFACLGFYCLSRHIFLQFLQKGIFVITKSFVQLLRKEYPDSTRLSKDDKNFINQIILQLKDIEQVIDELQFDPSNLNLIHEHVISNATQHISTKPVDLLALDPDYINSYFIPLSTLLDFLKSLANSPNSPTYTTREPQATPLSPSMAGANNNNPKYYTPPQSPVRSPQPLTQSVSQLTNSGLTPISTQAYIIRAYQFVEQNQNSVLNNIRKPLCNQ